MNNTLNIFLISIICFAGSSDLFGQVRKTKKKKPQGSSEFNYRYQDLNSRNNYFFNARLLLNESIKSLEENYQDDYSEILSVYRYEGGESASSVHPSMVTVIEKVSTDLQKHPNSKWADNEYILVGRAQNLNGDFDAAAETFQIVQQKFSNKIRSTKRGAKTSTKKKLSNVASRVKNTSGGSGTISKASSKVKAQSSNSVRAKQIAKLKAKRDREKAASVRKKAIAKRNKNRAKLKKINAKRRKQGKPRINYEDKFGSEEIPSAKSKEKEEEKGEEQENAKAQPEEEIKEEVVEEAAESEEEIEEAEAKKIFKDVPERKYARVGLFSHKLSNYDAALWEARNYIDQGSFGDAINVLNRLKQDENLSKNKLDDLYVLLAHYYLKKEEYSIAHEALGQAIDETRGKRKKSRLHFIRAQISEKKGNYSEAHKSYMAVIKSKPEYLMEFNARVKVALNKVKSGDFSREKANSYFAKMIKEEKNKDYLDQIYAAMAELALADGEIDEAIALLEKSVEENSENPQQKATTFLKLAELLYNNELFIKSGAYYDSAMTSLAKDYKNYEDISKRRNLLVDLTGHVQLVANQDSLQHLAGLSEKERNKIIDDYIKDFEARVQETLNRQNELSLLDNEKETEQSSSSGTWYFYNQRQKSLGFNEFKQKMGNRVLEDNWRRSQRNSNLITDDVSASTGVDAEDLVDLAGAGKLTRDIFIKNLPLTPEAIDASNKQIMESLFAIGNIYREGLKVNHKAKEYFILLNERFPGNKYEEQALYTLYLIAKEDGLTEEANNYAALLNKKYPDGLYTNLIKDPTYAEKQNNVDEEQTKFYEDTYNLYLEEQYAEVLNRKNQSENLYASSNTYKPQYDLLEAFVIGRTGEKDDYVSALQNVVAMHQTDPVKDKAEEILRYLDGKKAAEDAMFQYRDTKNVVHYFIVSLDKFTTDINKLLADFSNFNTANNQSRIKTTQMLLSPQKQIVLVKNFLNADKAMAYYNMVGENEPDIFKNLKGVGYQYFVVSKTNFTTLFKNKEVGEYMDYFEANYLK